MIPALRPSLPTRAPTAVSGPGVSFRQRLIVLVVVVATFSPALRNDFVWDDVGILVESNRLHEWSGVIKAFENPAVWSRDAQVKTIGTYRPLSLASFVIDFKIYGLAPWGFHLTNILLHGLTCLLLLGVFHWWLPGRHAPLMATVLFAIHPATVESVVWINGRSELFAGMFGALSLLVAVRQARNPGSKSAALGGLGALALLFSMLGKETGIAFCLLYLIQATAHRVSGEPNAHVIVIRPTRPAALLPPIVAIVAYAALRYTALAAATVPVRIAWIRLLSSLPAVSVRLLRAALVPLDRTPVTLGHWVTGLTSGEKALYVLAFGGGIAAVVLSWKRLSTTMRWGGLWWLVAGLPTLFVVTSSWPGLCRWIYVPLPGLLIFLASAASDLRAWLRRTLWIAATVISLLLLQRGIFAWRGDIPLFSAMVEDHPTDAFGYQGLGAAFLQRNAYQPAAAALEEAYRLGGKGMATVFQLSILRARLGHCDDALALYTTRADMPRNDRFFLALGSCFLAAGKSESAAVAYRSCPAESQACQAALDSFSARRAAPAVTPLR